MSGDMAKWLNKNLSIGVLISLITYSIIGVAYAAVLNSDVQTLKKQMESLQKDIPAIKSQVDKIEGYLRNDNR